MKFLNTLFEMSRSKVLRRPRLVDVLVVEELYEYELIHWARTINHLTFDDYSNHRLLSEYDPNFIDGTVIPMNEQCAYILANELITILPDWVTTNIGEWALTSHSHFRVVNEMTYNPSSHDYTLESRLSGYTGCDHDRYYDGHQEAYTMDKLAGNL